MGRSRNKPHGEATAARGRFYWLLITRFGTSVCSWCSGKQRGGALRHRAAACGSSPCSCTWKEGPRAQVPKNLGGMDVHPPLGQMGCYTTEHTSQAPCTKRISHKAVCVLACLGLHTTEMGTGGVPEKLDETRPSTQPPCSAFFPPETHSFIPWVTHGRRRCNTSIPLLALQNPTSQQRQLFLFIRPLIFSWW